MIAPNTINSLTPASPADVNAATVDSPAPSPATVAVTNSDPVFSPIPPAPVHSAPSPDAGAAPLFSSNTPEASGTARKAPSGSLFGEPSRILDRASLSSSADPGPCGWASTHLESALAPAMAADTATAPDLSDPPVAVAVSGALDFEAEVSALEAGWLAQGVSLADPLSIPPFLKRGADNVAPFIKNSTTFRVVQESLIQASVPSSDISTT